MVHYSESPSSHTGAIDPYETTDSSSPVALTNSPTKRPPALLCRSSKDCLTLKRTLTFEITYLDTLGQNRRLRTVFHWDQLFKKSPARVKFWFFKKWTEDDSDVPSLGIIENHLLMNRSDNLWKKPTKSQHPVPHQVWMPGTMRRHPKCVSLLSLLTIIIKAYAEK